MHQKDIERFAFLYLCSQRDKDMLTGVERMTFQDFDRLIYITDVLGLDQMNLEIWNRFSPQFKEQFKALEGIFAEDCRYSKFGEYEDGTGIYGKWFADFCDSVPDGEAGEVLRNMYDIYGDI